MHKTLPINMDNLTRELSLIPLFYINGANMVGSSIFTTSGFIMRDIQNPLAMLLCWLIGGLLALTGALCYGELIGSIMFHLMPSFYRHLFPLSLF